MRMPTEITIGLKEFRARPITFTVRVSRPLRFRIWLAVKMVRVASWLVGGNVVEDAE